MIIAELSISIFTSRQIDKVLISHIDSDVDGSFAVLKDAELRFINNLNNRLDTAVQVILLLIEEA